MFNFKKLQEIWYESYWNFILNNLDKIGIGNCYLKIQILSIVI